jgi:hypothetical protein
MIPGTTGSTPVCDNVCSKMLSVGVRAKKKAVMPESVPLTKKVNSKAESKEAASEKKKPAPGSMPLFQ